MTNQKTHVQGGATEEQIIAGAQAITAAWKSVHVLPRRLSEVALHAAAAVASSASVSADPADEHHDTEDQQAESEDHAETVTGEAGPSEARLAQARDSIDRTFGWQHLRKYGRMPEYWMDKLRDGLARNVLAFEEIPTVPNSEREKLIVEAQAVGKYLADPEYYEYRLIARLADALAAPFEIDEAKLAELLRSDTRLCYPDGGPVEWDRLAAMLAKALRGGGR